MEVEDAIVRDEWRIRERGDSPSRVRSVADRQGWMLRNEKLGEWCEKCNITDVDRFGEGL